MFVYWFRTNGICLLKLTKYMFGLHRELLKLPVTGLLVNKADGTSATPLKDKDNNNKPIEGVYELTGSFKTTATGAKAFSVGFTSGGATYTIHASLKNQLLKMVKLLKQKN